MPKIKIRNFGPIKEGYLEDDGWMDIKKVTVFIGNQGSGKSTVAKLISTYTWMEKAINRGDLNKNHISDLRYEDMMIYHGILNYESYNSEIKYKGDRFAIEQHIENNYINPVVKKDIIGDFSVPKIMYVPAERNFLSIIKNVYQVKNLPGTLNEFSEEFLKAQRDLGVRSIDLPLGNYKFQYDRDSEKSLLLLGDDRTLELHETSSGYQSLIPLYLVTQFLSKELQKGTSVLRDQLSAEQSIRRNNEIVTITFSDNLSQQEKDQRIKEIDARYLNTCFINIVEEPEQNLFPSSQRILLNSLLEFNNSVAANKLIMTTHSPYLINYLSIAIQAGQLLTLIRNSPETRSVLADRGGLGSTKTLEERINAIVPLNSVISSDDVVIYELNEKDGTIRKLPTPEGIPSDKNFLNQSIAEGNRLFDALLAIEEEI